MCCQPGHVGPDPEWYADTDGIPLDYPRSRVTGATLAVWARLLEPRNFTPALRPASTDGGSGRALPGRQEPPEPPEPDGSACEFNPWRGVSR